MTSTRPISHLQVYILGKHAAMNYSRSSQINPRSGTPTSSLDLSRPPRNGPPPGDMHRSGGPGAGGDRRSASAGRDMGGRGSHSDGAKDSRGMSVSALQRFRPSFEAPGGGAPTPLLPREAFISGNLMISIVKGVFPITVDVLTQILRPHGELLRVVIFHRFGVQSLVEFAAAEQAYAAAAALHGKDIYDGCCGLRIMPGKGTQHLKVSANCQLSHDFTNPGLSTQMPNNVLSPEEVATLEKEAFEKMEAGGGGMPPGAASGGAGGGPGAGAGAGGRPAGAGAGSGGGSGSGTASHAEAIAKQRSLPPSHCMHIQNLNPLEVSASRVFNVACCFGNVDFVEFRPPADAATGVADAGGATAVVQFEKPELAAQAVALLDGAMVMGWRWATRLGAPTDSAEGPEGPLPEGGDRAVFKDSMHNRFRTTGREETITAPTSVLYFSNLPATMTEEGIKTLFDQVAPQPVEKIAVFPPPRQNPGGRTPKRTGLVKLPTVEAATDVLAMANNAMFERHTLKLAYSSKAV